MNIKQSLYNGAHRLMGSAVGTIYEEYCRADAQGVPANTAAQRLVRLFDHCATHVPYYAGLMAKLGQDYRCDPFAYLQQLPQLNKSLIRQHFAELQSDDLERRRWQYNTSGGSTGVPVRFIQDAAFIEQQMAIQMLSYRWAGRKFGEPAVFIWGSERDVLQGTIGWKKKTLNALTNEQLFNAFRMTPERMRAFIDELNRKRPQLIVAYAQAMFELARFVEQEGLVVTPQRAILTSACTLYPFMREQIERVFGCKVFDRYGSREVGDIACQCSEHQGLHVFPWGNYVEVLDDEGQPVPAGVEGNLVITCLTNQAMPLIRYAIGDRGTLSPQQSCACGRHGQIIEKVAGRNVDSFRTKEGVLVDGEYFTHLLYFRPWVDRFQVVQTERAAIVFKIVPTQHNASPQELNEIVRDTHAVMGGDCRVDFQFVPELAPTASGKYRYTISEVV